jgi:uracil-DNA glycosylase
MNQVAPPILFVGNFMSDIVIVGQNPPELDQSNEAFMLRLEELQGQVADGTATAQDLEATFRYEFAQTPYAQALFDVFGRDMLDTYLMTWALRCRINGKPEQDHISACSSWTTAVLRRRKGVITIGGAAKTQVLGEQAGLIEFGQIRKNAPFFTVMALKPTTQWSKDDKRDYQTMLASFLADVQK